MMKIRIPDDFLRSQRSVSSESFPPYRKDRLDVYGFEGCVRDETLRENIAVYYIMEANCNPDFDW